MSVRLQSKPASFGSTALTPHRAAPSSFLRALRFREVVLCLDLHRTGADRILHILSDAGLFRALYISLTDWNLLRAPKFTGDLQFFQALE